MDHQPLLAKLVAPQEPAPSTWFSSERKTLLEETINPAKSFLEFSGLYRAALVYWVRWQASLEYHWPDGEEQHILSELKEKWIQKNQMNPLCNSPLLDQKLRVDPASKAWAKAQWSNKLESLFLSRKDALDQASCRVLRIKNKNLANEVFHQIKNREINFSTALSNFGENGPESRYGGKISLRPLHMMPYGLAPILKKLQRRKLSTPLKLGDEFALVELLEFKPCTLDSKTEEIILTEQLQLWLDSIADYILAVYQLDSANSSGQVSNV